MKFGGSDPTFSKKFTWGNYIIKHYTIGCCGLCGQKVKVWVDKCIVMGAPKFDQDMADRDAQADSANPNELSQRFANQSASGAQTMLVQVPPGLQGDMPMQVQTPNGLMQVQIPAGLQPGMAFQIQVPQPTTVELTDVSLTSSNGGDLERAAVERAAAEEERALAEAIAQSAASHAAEEQRRAATQAATSSVFSWQAWLTEKCGISASDAKLYADALADLGIDTPEDLHLIDGNEVAWPSVVKLVHRKKIVAGLESSRRMPLGRKMSDTI
jgi:hypothetical protein